MLFAALIWFGTAVDLPNRDFVVVPNGNDYYDGGAGVDVITYSNQRVPVTVNLQLQSGFGEGIETDRIVGIENIAGGHGDDTLIGDGGSNAIKGSDGDDLIAGLHGDDVLDGGQGDDQLAGGSGNDSYLFHPGDGADHIVEPRQSDARDVLTIVGDPATTSVGLQRWGEALLVDITTASTTDTVVVWDQFASPSAPSLEAIMLGDAAIWSSGELDALADRPAYLCDFFWFANYCPAHPDAQISQMD